MKTIKLPQYKEEIPGADAVELLGLQLKKRRLSPVEKQKVARLEESIRLESERMKQPKVSQCTCRGFKQDPHCPLHHRIG